MAASKAHEEQLMHVRKGCLACIRQDVASDGSRIEGSHKGWNGLQRSHASGVKVLSALCHDFVLCCNICIGITFEQPSEFLKSTFGSHYIGLVGAVAKLWNSLLPPESGSRKHFRALPELKSVSSGENFSLVSAKSVTNYQNLVKIKEEPREELFELSSEDRTEVDAMLRDLDIDPMLLFQPAGLPQATDAASRSQLILPRSGNVIQSAMLTGESLLKNRLNLVPSSAACADADVMPSAQDEPAVVIAGPSTSEKQAGEVVIVETGTKVGSNSLHNTTCSSQRLHALQGASSRSEDAVSPSSSDLTQGARNRGCASRSGLELLKFTMPAQTIPSKRRAEPEATSSASEGHHMDGSDGAPSRPEGHRKKARTVTPGLAAGLTLAKEVSTVSSTACITDSDIMISTALPPSSKSSHGQQVVPDPNVPHSRVLSTSTLVSFFNMAHPAAASASAKSQELLPMSNLPLPTISGLTPSQRLFSLSTSMNIKSLSISSNDEFYLFMDMRAEKKWASFSMTPCKWVIVASEYNARLESFHRSRGQAQLMVRKAPRALMEKLGELEPKIIARIVGNHYTSKQSNTDDFWQKHCDAVPGLIKNGKGESKTSARKTCICSRCKTIMWPGPEGMGNNHKKSYCSDGVMQKPRTITKMVGGLLQDVTKHPPDWPQLWGIFTNGTHFHPGPFLATIHEVYDCVIVKGGTGEDRAMEYSAFAALLSKRTVVSNDGAVFFELFSSLEVTSAREFADAIVEHDGIKFFRIDSLHSTPENANSDGSNVGEDTVIAVV
ncbi:hypothetical protein SCP_0606250 [Sparassis crispa]|uniref:Uncharacterized protein n=1 Tax=Sparassis crispa TaxID=139825 RepID=A0A401GR05_9APHY|nr:hypothetical protein SCP_0606250 [Sparassis crispa]GBE84646.1 hypothetical protein SCP_0606250 [Sparassis crispa]